MPEVRISGAASDLRAAHSITQILQLHHGGRFNGLGEGRPAAAAFKLVRGGKERFAGDNIHIDPLFELIPECIAEGALCAALLRDAVLLLRQLVADRLRHRLLIVARINAQLGEQRHLRPRDMAVAARIFLQIVLVVRLGGIVVFQRSNLHGEPFTASPLDFGDAFHRFSRAVVGVVNAGLVLASDVVALPVLHRGVDDVEVSQQQRVKTHLLGVVFHPNGLPEAGVPLADGLVDGVRLAGSVGVAALGVKNAGDGLHELFHAPKAAARQIDDVFCGIHMCARLAGDRRRLFGHFLLFRFPQRVLLPGGTSAQRQHHGKQKRPYAPIHGVFLPSEGIIPSVSPCRRQRLGR